MKYKDFSKDLKKQFLVDKDNIYLGHPSTIINNKKELLCVYPKGHGRGEIIYKKSFDYGKTWTERLKTPDSWKYSQETPILYKLQDKIILLSGRYPSKLSYSLDEGESWSEFKEFDWGGLVVFSSLLHLNNKYVAFFHDNGKFFKGSGVRGDFTLYQIESEDGINWGKPKSIYVSRQGEKFCEPYAILSPNKQQVLLLLRNNFKKFSFGMTSDNFCKTWNRPFQLNIHLSGDRHIAKYIDNERLFISFRGKNQGKFYHDWCGWTGSYNDILKNKPGDSFIRIMQNKKDGGDCAYPCIEMVDDVVINTTYGSWDGGLPYIMCVRINKNEL